MDTDPSGAGANWLLPGTTWRLAEIDGAAPSGVTTATLTEDGRIVGQGPCNRFVSTYAGRWPDLTFAPVAMTRMACPDLAAETAFLSALSDVRLAAIDDSGITLSGETHSLRFVRDR